MWRLATCVSVCVGMFAYVANVWACTRPHTRSAAAFVGPRSDRMARTLIHIRLLRLVGNNRVIHTDQFICVARRKCGVQYWLLNDTSQRHDRDAKHHRHCVRIGSTTTVRTRLTTNYNRDNVGATVN